jgi:hypothetical protein
LGEKRAGERTKREEDGEIDPSHAVLPAIFIPASKVQLFSLEYSQMGLAFVPE